VPDEEDRQMQDIECSFRALNVARIFNYLPEGRDNNFAVDRDQADAMLQVCPQPRDMARDGRVFTGPGRHLGSRSGRDPVHRPQRRGCRCLAVPEARFTRPPGR
jgi:hypothetical protein